MVFAYLPLEQEVGIEPTIVEYNTRPYNGRVYLFRHSCIWYQNLVSIQATVVYETSVDADPSGIMELKETNPCLFWHTLLRQKPAVWFTARNTWICLLGRQARPTYFVRLLCSITLILVSLKSFWLGCSRRIRTLSPGYGPSMLPLHHHCDISESLQYPRNLIPTSH